LQEKLIFVLALFFFFFRETSFEYKCHIQRIFWGTILFQPPHPPLSEISHREIAPRAQRPHDGTVCLFGLQESSTRRRDKRREDLSARAAFFFVDGGSVN
jgi:hypothetical protein